MASKRSPARMRRLVAVWRTSGETGAHFARRHQIPAWTFWYWCRKQSVEAPDTPAPTFVPVHVVPESDAGIEITLPGGERVHVRPGASGELVRVVVSALRSAC